MKPFRQAGVDIDMGLELFSTFRQAGLPGTEMVLSSRVEGGPDSQTRKFFLSDQMYKDSLTMTECSFDK
jgi:hypothetical protein